MIALFLVILLRIVSVAAFVGLVLAGEGWWGLIVILVVFSTTSYEGSDD